MLTVAPLTSIIYMGISPSVQVLSPYLVMGKGPPHYVFISEITALPTLTYAMAHPKAQGGYWTFYVSMPCRHLALTVNSNISASITAQVMRGLRAKAPCGK